jgi:hypothetical protein
VTLGFAAGALAAERSRAVSPSEDPTESELVTA